MPSYRQAGARSGVGGFLALLIASQGAEAGNFVRSEGHAFFEGRYNYDFATDYWTRYDPATGTQRPDYAKSSVTCLSGTGPNAVEYPSCRAESRVFSMNLEYGASYYNTLYANLGYGESRYVPTSQGMPASATARSLPTTEPKQGPTDSIVGIRGRFDPYRNYQSWEVEATLPTSRAESGQSRLGCGVYGGAMRAEQKIELASRPVEIENGQPYLSLEGGAAAYYWQRPLNPQARAYLAFSGNVSANWSWYLGASGLSPLVEKVAAANVNGALADCGTFAKQVAGSFEIKHQFTADTYFFCGGTGLIWGQDTTQSRGFHCGLNRLWK